MAIFQVTWLQRWLEQEIRNIFYYETTVGEPSDAEWVDIVDEVRALLVGVGIENWVNDWFFYGIDRRRVDTPGLLSFRELPTAGNLVGTGTADSTATQVAMLLGIKGTTTKPNRARSYLCGFAQDDMDNSIWNLGLRGDMETLILLAATLNTGGTNPLQRVAAQWNSSHTQVTVWNEIHEATPQASPVPATQRRRRIGVGI